MSEKVGWAFCAVAFVIECVEAFAMAEVFVMM